MEPKLKELRKYTDYDLVPVYEEILSDSVTPLNVLRNIKEISEQFYLLESVDPSKFSRYSYLGYNPIHMISCKDYIVNLDGNKFKSDNPFDEVKKLLSKFRAPKLKNMPPFCGGLIGYAAYDSYKYFEKKLKLESEDIAKFNDYEFLLFDKVICFDSYTQKIYIIANVKTCDLENNYKKAFEDINKIKELITKMPNLEEKKNIIIKKPESIDNYDEYENKLNIVKKHIYDGDIFQCVFSRRFKGKMEGDLYNTYRVLRGLNPSPYMIYFNSDDVEIAGASPETLVRKINDKVTTFPIAGTRPRGKDEKEDIMLEESLRVDEKELAEHNMLVDLGRNDIGKISKFGSVDVTRYQYIQKFSHVMHITSTVNGKIRDDKDAIDALQALLPAGTLSGAPKIRACQIIDELEPVRRGIYGGAIGYIDFRGNLDMCICIRTAIKKGDDIYVQSGGGIVLDSVAKNEYLETENKAKAILRAIEMSEGDLL